MITGKLRASVRSNWALSNDSLSSGTSFSYVSLSILCPSSADSNILTSLVLNYPKVNIITADFCQDTSKIFISKSKLIPLHFSHFYSLKQRRNDCLMDLRRTFFESMNQTIDCKSRTWYLKHQAQVDSDLAQRIPPSFYFLQIIKKRNPFNFARI